MEKKYIVKIDGKEWTLPSPMKLKHLKVLEPELTTLKALATSGKLSTVEYFAAAEKIIVAAISSVDTSFTSENLQESYMNSGSMSDAIQTIAYASGVWLEPKKEDGVTGEAQPGEAQAKA